MQPGEFTRSVQSFTILSIYCGFAMIITSLLLAWFANLTMVFWRSIKFISAVFAVISVAVFILNIEKAVKPAQLHIIKQEKAKQIGLWQKIGRMAGMKCDKKPYEIRDQDNCELIQDIIDTIERGTVNARGHYEIPKKLASPNQSLLAMGMLNGIHAINATIDDLNQEFGVIDPQWYMFTVFSGAFLLILSVAGSAGEALFQLKISIADNKRKLLSANQPPIKFQVNADR